MSAQSQISICELPDDILVIIFGFSGDGFDVTYPRSRYNMMAVCQSWRQLIISSPLLWKNLSLSLSVPLPCHTYQTFSQALRLSAETPLSISLRIGPSRPAGGRPTSEAMPELEETLLATMNTLYSSASRWISLSIRITNRLLCSLLPPLQHNMSSLEQVFIYNVDCFEGPRIFDACPIFAFPSAPKLGTFIYFSDVAMFSNVEFPWASVRDMFVQWPRYSDPLMERTGELLHILGAAVELEELKLFLSDRNARDITGSLPCIISTSIPKFSVSSYCFKVLSYLRLPLLRELHLSVQANPEDQEHALVLAIYFVASSPRLSLLSGSSFIFSPSIKPLLEGTPSVTSLSWTFHSVDVDAGFLAFLSTSTCLPLLEAFTIEFGRGECFLVEEETQFDEKFVAAVLHLATAPHRVGMLKRLDISISTFYRIPLDLHGEAIADIRDKVRERRGTDEGIELTITVNGVYY